MNQGIVLARYVAFAFCLSISSGCGREPAAVGPVKKFTLESPPRILTPQGEITYNSLQNSKSGEERRLRTSDQILFDQNLQTGLSLRVETKCDQTITRDRLTQVWEGPLKKSYAFVEFLPEELLFRPRSEQRDSVITCTYEFRVMNAEGSQHIFHLLPVVMIEDPHHEEISLIQDSIRLDPTKPDQLVFSEPAWRNTGFHIPSAKDLISLRCDEFSQNLEHVTSASTYYLSDFSLFQLPLRINTNKPANTWPLNLDKNRQICRLIARDKGGTPLATSPYFWLNFNRPIGTEVFRYQLHENPDRIQTGAQFGTHGRPHGFPLLTFHVHNTYPFPVIVDVPASLMQVKGSVLINGPSNIRSGELPQNTKLHILNYNQMIQNQIQNLPQLSHDEQIHGFTPRNLRVTLPPNGTFSLQVNVALGRMSCTHQAQLGLRLGLEPGQIYFQIFKNAQRPDGSGTRPVLIARQEAPNYLTDPAYMFIAAVHDRPGQFNIQSLKNGMTGRTVRAGYCATD